MQRYSFRLVLRDVIRIGAAGQFTAVQLTRHASLDAVHRHLEQLASLGLVAQNKETYSLEMKARSLGPTMEWFVAESLRRELDFTVGLGVPLRGASTGGDLDVLAQAEGRLIYLEVKSGPPKHQQLSHIAAFLDRVEALAPDGAIFFEDTELRMKDKIVVLFEEVLQKRGSPRRPERLQRELFTVGPGLYIANAHPDVTSNLASCVAHLLRSSGVQLFVDDRTHSR
jgi:hypothetical protein